MTEFDHQQAVTEYLNGFKHRVKVHKNLIHYGEIRAWCQENLGLEFKDWFWYSGGRYDEHAGLMIKDDKRYMLFVLKWGADL